MLCSCNCWCNSHRLAKSSPAFMKCVFRQRRPTRRSARRASAAIFTLMTVPRAGLFVCRLHCASTCWPMNLGSSLRDLWPVGWDLDLSCTWDRKKAGPHPLPFWEMMHCTFSTIAPCRLTQAFRAPGCVTSATSYCVFWSDAQLYNKIQFMYMCGVITVRQTGSCCA